MLDTVKINHVQHISFTQSRLTDAVSVILSELLSYEHPSNPRRLVKCAVYLHLISVIIIAYMDGTHKGAKRARNGHFFGLF